MSFADLHVQLGLLFCLLLNLILSTMTTHAGFPVNKAISSDVALSMLPIEKSPAHLDDWSLYVHPVCKNPSIDASGPWKLFTCLHWAASNQPLEAQYKTLL